MPNVETQPKPEQLDYDYIPWLSLKIMKGSHLS